MLRSARLKTWMWPQYLETIKINEIESIQKYKFTLFWILLMEIIRLNDKMIWNTFPHLKKYSKFLKLTLSNFE